MLEKFRKAKLGEIALLETMRNKGLFPGKFGGPRSNFWESLQVGSVFPAVIAEFKQASPSLGPICDKLTVEDAVCQFAANGASAISILTEENWFAGHIDYIKRAWLALENQARLPILRKDFIFHPLQIEATAATPASALLLIVRMLPDPDELGKLQEHAETYGMQCVVEVFDERELEIARQSGAKIIQVNARDLDALKVDRDACLKLAGKCPPKAGERWIAASGLNSSAQLVRARDAGYDAVLTGSFLMRDARPGQALASLLNKCYVN